VELEGIVARSDFGQWQLRHQEGRLVSRVSTYLNFMGNTEVAFNSYRSVSGTEFVTPISRIGYVPGDENLPALSEVEKKLVMHIELPVRGVTC
jgi:PhnB protein